MNATSHDIATARLQGSEWLGGLRAHRLGSALEGLARELADSRIQLARLRRDRRRLEDELSRVRAQLRAAAPASGEAASRGVDRQSPAGRR